jgi:hypothetical protein
MIGTVALCVVKNPHEDCTLPTAPDEARGGPAEEPANAEQQAAETLAGGQGIGTMTMTLFTAHQNLPIDSR